MLAKRWTILLVLALALFAALPARAATDCATVTDVSQAECEALVDLYNSTGGAGWLDSTGWLDDDTVCDWTGVTCQFNGVSFYVSDLWLGFNNLSGTLPASLTNLTGLSLLYMPDNSLSGTIPDLSSLGTLTYLNLGENGFSGTLPAWITGTNFPALDFLSLGGNNFTGSIPSDYATLTSLTWLELGNNGLSGAMPDLSGLDGLVSLGVGNNQILTGTIGNWLNGTNFPALTSLNIGRNEFSGALPDMSGTALEYLDMGYNDWTSGPIPAWITGSTTLKYLTLSMSARTGSFPTFASPVLEQVLLDYNGLSGTIPSTFNATNHPNLIYFGVLYNQLSGAVPAEIGGFNNLIYLNLGSNLFTSVPVELANLTNIPASTNYALNVGFNGLPLTGIDTNLKNFLDARDPDWMMTQTVAPINVSASAVDGDSITLSWTPVLFSGCCSTGYYDVGVGTASGGPYTFGNQTANKAATGLTINGLTPDTPYYFVVRTTTNGSLLQYNTITSGNSAEASATTTSGGPVTTDCNAVSQIPSSECNALIDLYTGTNGASWTTSTGWNTNNTPCSWSGVTCSGGHVTGLNLGSNNLDGILPASLSELDLLTSLNLSYNPALSGDFPLWVFTLTGLSEISVAGTDLDAGGAALSTTGIESQTTLTFLQLDGLNFSGAVPNLSASTGLYWLQLSDLGLSGSVPGWISSATALQRIVLSNNALTGNLPNFSALTNLVYLEINSTDITGPLPDVSAATGLFFISLANNRFTGSIPSGYGNLTNLSGLNLEQNALSGNFPASLTNLTDLGVGVVLSYVGFGYNSLTIDTSNTALVSFINTVDPDWADTQTVAPANFATGTIDSDSISLSWTPIAYTDDGGYYEITYNVNTRATVQTADKTTGSISLEGLTPDTPYVIQIRTVTPAHAANKNALTSSAVEINASTTGGAPTTLPTAPVLTAPANNSQVIGDASPVFTWNENPAAQAVTVYRLTITNAAKVNVVNQNFNTVDICTGGVCSVDLGTLTTPLSLLNGTYTWRVRATNIIGSKNSALLTFTIVFPGKPVLQSPIGNTVINDASPEFVWSEVPAAAQYRLRVFNSANTVVASTTWLDSATVNCDGTSCSYDITPTGLKNGAHTWQVEARDTSVITGVSKSAKGAFKVSYPGVAALLTPTNNDQFTDRTPAFSWSEVPNATAYRLQIVRVTATGMTSVFDKSYQAATICVTGTCTVDLGTLTTPVTLPRGNFKWRVQSKAGVGYLVWSPRSNFKIIP